MRRHHYSVILDIYINPHDSMEQEAHPNGMHTSPTTELSGQIHMLHLQVPLVALQEVSNLVVISLFGVQNTTPIPLLILATSVAFLLAMPSPQDPTQVA